MDFSLYLQLFDTVITCLTLAFCKVKNARTIVTLGFMHQVYYFLWEF